MELTILIPALDEETTIEECIKKAKSFLINENIDGEILVVNNNSKDSTELIARKEGVKVGKFVHIGAGAVIKNNIQVKDCCIIGAGL